jgi:hypothetical protein
MISAKAYEKLPEAPFNSIDVIWPLSDLSRWVNVPTKRRYGRRSSRHEWPATFRQVLG